MVGNGGVDISGTINVFGCDGMYLGDFVCDRVYLNYSDDAVVNCEIAGYGSDTGLSTYYCSDLYSDSYYIENFLWAIRAYYSFGQGSGSQQLYNNDNAVYANNSDFDCLYWRFCGISNWDLYAESGSYIWAAQCCYTDGTPNTYGNVYCQGALNCNNNCSASLMKVTEDQADGSGDNPALTEYGKISKQHHELSKKIETDRHEQKKIDHKKYTNEYNTIIRDYSSFIEKYHHSDLAKTALTNMVHCYRNLGEYNALQTFIQGIKADKKLANLNDLADLHRIFNYRDRHDFATALSTADHLLETYKADNAMTCDMLFAKGSMYAHDLNKPAEAAVCFSRLTQAYPKHPLASLAEYELSLLGDTIHEEMNESEATDQKLSINNYPNPFNPTTRIVFILPQRDELTLKVFDMLGRQVAVLMDGTYEAGRHEAEFDAAGLPSGLYFYHLQTTQHAISKKMLMVK